MYVALTRLKAARLARVLQAEASIEAALFVEMSASASNTNLSYSATAIANAVKDADDLITPATTLLLGDTVDDMRAARAAGTQGVTVYNVHQAHVHQ